MTRATQWKKPTVCSRSMSTVPSACLFDYHPRMSGIHQHSGLRLHSTVWVLVFLTALRFCLGEIRFLENDESWKTARSVCFAFLEPVKKTTATFALAAA